MRSLKIILNCIPAALLPSPVGPLVPFQYLSSHVYAPQERQREELQQKLQHLRDDHAPRPSQAAAGRQADDASAGANLGRLGAGEAADLPEPGRYGRPPGADDRAQDNGAAGVAHTRPQKPRKKWSPPRVDPEQVEQAVEEGVVRVARKRQELTPEQRWVRELSCCGLLRQCCGSIAGIHHNE